MSVEYDIVYDVRESPLMRFCSVLKPVAGEYVLLPHPQAAYCVIVPRNPSRPFDSLVEE